MIMSTHLAFSIGVQKPKEGPISQSTKPVHLDSIVGVSQGVEQDLR